MSRPCLGYSAAGVVVARDVSEFQPRDRVACAGLGHASHAGVISVPKAVFDKELGDGCWSNPPTSGFKDPSCHKDAEGTEGITVTKRGVLDSTMLWDEDPIFRSQSELVERATGHDGLLQRTS